MILNIKQLETISFIIDDINNTLGIKSKRLDNLSQIKTEVFTVDIKYRGDYDYATSVIQNIVDGYGWAFAYDVEFTLSNVEKIFTLTFKQTNG